MKLEQLPVFDSHFHIIDRRFPLVPNQGYMPEDFTCKDYLARTASFHLAGGAVVSGSFQSFDQSYLLAALNELGPSFVGVTQLPVSVADTELISLDRAGVRAIRFNLKRGGSEGIDQLESFGKRVHETVGWHTELYIDSRELEHIKEILLSLPAVSIDHLGLSRSGFSTLLSLVEKGVYVKATGFGRVDFDVKNALKDLSRANPQALHFGTDLPSTRAPRPFTDDDLLLVIDALGEELARKVLYDNAVALYRPATTV